MEEKLMVEKLQFNLLNMNLMLKGFIKGGSLRSLLGEDTGQEVVVLEEDTVMIIGTGILGEEAAAEAETGMIGTMVGNEDIAIEAEAVATLQTMTGAVVGVVMTMSVEAGVILLKVLVLKEAYRLARAPLRVEFSTVAAPDQTPVCHQVVTILIPGVLYTVLMRSDCLYLSCCHLVAIQRPVMKVFF